MWGRGPGSNGGVLFYIGEIKNLAFFKLENFKTFIKINEKFIIFKKFLKEILRFFENFVKI